MEELQCNIVVMKRSQPKVLRLNLVGSPKEEPDLECPYKPDLEDRRDKTSKECCEPVNSIRGRVVTPTSRPEARNTFHCN